MRARHNPRTALSRLANRYGIALSYVSTIGETVDAPTETVLAVLRALGAQITSLDDCGKAYDRRLAEEQSILCKSTSIAWDGEVEFIVRLPLQHSPSDLRISILLEDGDERNVVGSRCGHKVIGSVQFDDRSTYVVHRVKLPWPVPPGYHRLELTSREHSGTSLLISAPRKAFQHQASRTWGTFLPLYSLHSATSWGAGSFNDMRRLMEWTTSVGGSYTGTLPLLATFLAEPYVPSPYSPVSRLFWNEFYIDIEAVPEYVQSAKARALVASTEFQDSLDKLRSSTQVDYREGMRLRRLVLEHLADTLLDQQGERHSSFHHWLETNPKVLQYARFRAVCERYDSGPSGWPEAWSPEQIDVVEYDASVCHFHSYAQWIAEQQLTALPQLPESDVGLYLDLPLGVHGDGYDVWREPDVFALGFSVGAPPDSLGVMGQNWGFPPLHPIALQNQGYRHLIEVVRHHMRHASMLRIDHIMGLHRQFWIPDGAESKDGVYVRYPIDDLYAILSLESHRNQTELIGEDLGTVPVDVRPAMADHGVSRMIIVPFEVWPDSTSLANIPEQSLVALNTHDIPPFAGIWESWFDNERQAVLVQFLQNEGRLAETCAHDLDAIVSATLEYIGASAARTVLVNLEDLWLEKQSQNIPGTTDDEHANWRHKASQSFETFSTSTPVLNVLARLDATRRRRDNEDVSV